jgi:hypothetical protein
MDVHGLAVGNILTDETCVGLILDTMGMKVYDRQTGHDNHLSIDG